MFKGYYNLVSGMLTQGRRLDIISNNMTNVSTAGYKTDRFTYSTFQDVMWLHAGNKTKNYTQLGTESFITAPSQLYTNYEQASFDETATTLDFGIDGDGFFAIETAGGIAYTRNGHFSLDDEGYLCLPGHGRVLSDAGEPLQLPTDHLISDDFGGLFSEDGEALGRLGVYTFPDLGVLTKTPEGLYTSAAVGQGALVRVHHKMVERSNVDMAQQMVDMIESERAYQSAASVTKMYDEVINKAANDIGRL